MDALINLLTDPANRPFVWAAAGFFLFDAMVLFLMAKRLGDREIHASKGGVVVRTNTGQINTGRVDGGMFQNHSAGSGPDRNRDREEGDSVNLGLVLNIAGSLSSIIGLGLAVFAALKAG